MPVPPSEPRVGAPSDHGTLCGREFLEEFLSKAAAGFQAPNSPRRLPPLPPTPPRRGWHVSRAPPTSLKQIVVDPDGLRLGNLSQASAEEVRPKVQEAGLSI